MRTLYPMRSCRHCDKRFQALSPNQQICRDCRPKRRRRYMRDYRRKERRELKKTWQELEQTNG